MGCHLRGGRDIPWFAISEKSGPKSHRPLLAKETVLGPASLEGRGDRRKPRGTFLPQRATLRKRLRYTCGYHAIDQASFSSPRKITTSSSPTVTAAATALGRFVSVIVPGLTGRP